MAITETPPTDLPEWATSGTNVGTPAPARIVSGWAAGEIPAAMHMNWILNLLATWVRYLWARVQSYETLQALYAGLADGETSYLREMTAVASAGRNAWGSEFATNLDNVTANTVVAGNGPYLILATSGGEPRVVDRYIALGAGARPTLFTLTRNTAATNSAIVCRGDHCAVASGNRVDIFVISTGVRLWSYDHGAQVYDVAISNDYVCYVGVTSGGVRIRTLNLLAGTSVNTSGGALSMVGVTGLPDGRWAVQYAGGVTMYSADLSVTPWGTVSANIGNTLPRNITNDGAAVYVGSDSEYITRLNCWDGSTEWQMLSPAPVIAIAVDHGGVFAAVSDGAGDDRLLRLDKAGGGNVYDTDTVDTASAIHADGAGVFVALDGAKFLTAYIRGNRPGAWMRVSALEARYLAYPWLTQPVGEE